MSESATNPTATAQASLGVQDTSESQSIVKVLGDETALPSYAATECEVDILKERVRTLSAQVKDGFRKIADLQEQARAARADLTQIQNETFVSDDARSRRMRMVYKELFNSLEREPTTSPLDVEVELTKLAEEWLEEITQGRGYIETWHKDNLALRNSQIAEINKHPEAVANLTRHEIEYWHQALVYIRWYSHQIHETLLAANAAIKAIQVTSEYLKTKAAPLLVGLAFEVAKSAKDTFDSLSSSLSDVIVYDVEKHVVSAEGYVRHHRSAGSLKT